MFARICMAWTWALVMLVGILNPPDWSPRWRSAFVTGLALVFVYQCLFVLTMTWREYHRLRALGGELTERGYELQEEALREAAEPAYE